MKFKVLVLERDGVLVSDSITVERFTDNCRRVVEKVPDIKEFRTLAYLHPPRFIEANSAKEAAKIALGSG